MQTLFGISLPENIVMWSESAAVFALIFVAGFLFKKYILKFLQKIVEKSGLVLGDDIVISSKNYVSFWFFLTALYCSYLISPLEHKYDVIDKAFFVLLAFSFVVLAASVAAKIFQRAVSEAIGVNIIKFVVIFIGIVLILNQIGVKLTPILTALGVGSLAVALALQDTLSNFFAGVNILASGQIMRGDYIQLDSGQEGRVIEINWRTTRIREISNNVITVPNTKISSAIVKIVHSLNAAELTVSVKCGVSYDSDLEKVEAAAIAAVTEVLNSSEGAAKTFKPIVRFGEFADSSINFSVIFRVRDMYVRSEVVHNVIKSIKKKFDAQHIEIPFPQRVVTLKKD
ncbi:mechanosensitive ion channel family protein [Endomicrobium proavitum]|uniref:MscS-like mechanosensitive channel n=1 Tax=Endomicrobium proavitum TaxID=1408281 RepID=A0A0G3WIU0_9BACT|nr:mechanosensitive ion channel family protein [Endomicrobium proavitum]AKL97792.1 MscS-like mechanosensitive channel [Endomicrobium proavitum]